MLMGSLPHSKSFNDQEKIPVVNMLSAPRLFYRGAEGKLSQNSSKKSSKRESFADEGLMISKKSDLILNNLQ